MDKLLELKEEVRKLQMLLEEPEVGLFTWHGMLHQRLDAIRQWPGPEPIHDKPKERKVEVAVLYRNKTWDTEFVLIPADTPENQIEQVGKSTFMHNFFHVSMTGVCLYDAPEIEE